MQVVESIHSQCASKGEKATWRSTRPAGLEQGAPQGCRTPGHCNMAAGVLPASGESGQESARPPSSPLVVTLPGKPG